VIYPGWDSRKRTTSDILAAEKLLAQNGSLKILIKNDALLRPSELDKRLVGPVIQAANVSKGADCC
jgi:hypothetical protein